MIQRLRRLLARFHRDESGVVLLEFSVVFPAQLLVTLGIMQLSLLVVGHIVVEHAAFAAARAALVQDVPPPGSGAGSGLAGGPTQAMQNAAKHAAALALATISPPDADLANAPISGTPTDLRWPKSNGGTFTLGRERGAYGLAQVTVDPPAVASPDYCAVEVKFEFPLVIPVVNAFFAKAGPYLLYGVPSGVPIHGYGIYPTLPVTKTAVLPRPWSRQ